MKKFEDKPELSIIATVYNSARIVVELLAQIKSAVDALNIPYEIILVDDGSRDDSAFIMEQQSQSDLRVKSIILSRNFGQQVAMSAGVHHASGQFVVIMDGDLQNPSEAIPQLYQKAHEGYDIVYTSSPKKNDLYDSATSWLFWKFLKFVVRADVVESQLMMRIMTAEVAEYYRGYPEKIRTVAAITHDIGMNCTVICVENQKRKQGKSNYNTLKRMNLAIDVILDFSNRPLNFVFYLGGLIFLLTIGATLYYLYSYLTQNTLPGFTSLALLILLFGSINLICIGVLARYVANIYTEVKRRPLYFVRKSINFPKK
jgi:glycosyltransferase involved in cell wall biosynthesis